MDTLGPALQGLLAMAEARLIECDRPVGLVHLAPGGEVAWDNCCEGAGQLWVRVQGATPQPQPSPPCGMTDLSVRVGLGVVRCMHGVDDEGLPTATEMTADTLSMTDDAALLLWALRLWEKEGAGKRFVVPRSLNVESGTPLGPSGFCGGWEWTLSFRLQVCDGC